MNTQKLASWIRRRPGETIALALYYSTPSDTLEPVCEWTLKDLAGEPDETVANAILIVAQDDCDEREIVARYSLQAVGDKNAVLRTQVLKCYPDNSNKRPDPLDVGDVAANNAISQMVRMNEILVRMMVNGQVTLLNGYKQLIEAQAAEIHSLRYRERAANEILQAAGSIDPHAEQKNEALTKLVTLAEKWAPSIVAGWSGGNGAPAV